MTAQIDFIDETEQLEEKELSVLKRVLTKAAQMEGLDSDFELSLSFVDNERIQGLNRDYRGKDQPTDVLSFALEEGEELPAFSEDAPRMLGDIVISVPKTKEQADEYNHSFMRELGFLAVHGFLHLLKYDHDTEKNQAMMFSRQKEILESYGLKR
jgi:probable rRNA maturation factor